MPFSTYEASSTTNQLFRVNVQGYFKWETRVFCGRPHQPTPEVLLWQAGPHSSITQLLRVYAAFTRWYWLRWSAPPGECGGSSLRRRWIPRNNRMSHARCEEMSMAGRRQYVAAMDSLPSKHKTLAQCWPIVFEAGPTSNQHWTNVSYLCTRILLAGKFSLATTSMCWK